MKNIRVILSIIVMFIVCELWAADGSSWWNADYVTTEGTEFWVTFMRNRGSDENDTDLELYLFATSRSNATVTISNPNTSYKDTFTVNAGQRSTRIKIDNLQAYIANPEKVEKKGLMVTSDNPISLYAINYVQGSQDATYLYPTKGYSNNDANNDFTGFTNKQYIIQTFNTDETATEFAVVATEDKTEVDITIKESIFNGVDDYPELPYSDTIINDTTIRLTLNKGQTYLYRASTAYASLSGTSICSNNNIVVFQGGQHSQIPSYYYEPDNHIWSQALPTYLWGRDFVITQSGTQKADGVLITAAEDSTNLSIDTIGGVIDTTINKLQTFDFYMHGKPYSVVHASKAVECFLYQTSYRYPEYQTYGSPAMIPIIPIENRFNSIIYATFEFHNPQIKPEDQKHYINIVTLTSGVPSMMMKSSKNGSPLGTLQSLSDKFNEVIGTEYSYAIIDVSDKGESHVLYNEKEGFVAHAYVFGKTKGSYKESYGYSLGTNLLPSAWMLIDGEKINKKQICLNNIVNFGPVVNFESEPVQWEVHHHNNHESIDSNDLNYNFPDTGRYDIYMIVNRQTPICNNTISDTVMASIIVRDAFHILPSIDDGNFRIICAKDRSHELVSGETYQYRSDTMQVNKTYSFIDSLKTVAGCDSIVDIKVFVAPEYKTQKYDTICVNNLPYSMKDQSNITSKTHDLDPSDKASLILTSENTFKTKHINDIDTLKSIFGCDSIVDIQLTILPIYQLHQYDTACVDSVGNYHWTNHEMTHVYDENGNHISSISLKQGGEYVYYDSLKTHGCHTCQQAQHCDSVWILHLKVLDRFVNVTSSSICSDESYFWEDTLWLGKDCPIPATGKYKRVLSSDTVLNHTFVRKNKFECDSVIVLHLQIGEKYEVDYRDTICDNEELVYEGKIYKNLTARDEPYQYDVMLHSVYGCDSLVHFYLKVFPAYHYPVKYDTICESSLPYNYEDTRALRLQNLTSSGLYKDTIPSIHGCDSVIELQLKVWETTFYEHNVLWCYSDGAYEYGERGKTAIETGTYKDTLLTKNAHGCDSVEIVHLTVQETIVDVEYETICDETCFNHHDMHATKLQGLTETGIYRDTIKSIFDCDSVIELHLQVGEKYEVDYRDTICDNEELVYEGKIYKNLIAQDEPYQYDVMLYSMYGCDSLVHFYLKVYPTYSFSQDTVVCQDRNNNWEWTDEFGGLHVLEDPISIANVETLHLVDNLSTQYGCDSTFTINIKIVPSYYFFDTLNICDDDTIHWQDSVIAGSKYTGDYSLNLRDAKPAGAYDYSINYSTAIYHCDSTYNLHLIINPTYTEVAATDTTVRYICDNEIYHFKTATQDTIYNQTIRNWVTDDKSIGRHVLTGMDTTIHGCDSAVAHVVYVHPSYLFVTDTSICTSDRLFWRGKKYVVANDTIIEERYTTTYGCDSVYQLQIHAMQSYLFRMHRQICDDETLYHINNNYVIWQPGQDIPEPDDCNGLLYQTYEGCDSLYCYYITVHPSFFFDDNINVCSGDQYIFHETRTILYDHIYDTGTWIPAIDTLITDTFSTVYGCDSVYWLHATIYPTYKHVDYATICDNECFTWRDRTYCGTNATGENPYVAGTYVFYDSLLTEHGCDSIYVLELTIHPTYFYELHEAICDNDEYNFHGRILSGIAGEYFYTDSLYSIFGCDSVYHLYLTINPTTSEVLYDTLCAGESYKFNDKLLYDDGYYIDTTTNEWGCQHVTELYLTVEDPTTVQIEISDICGKTTNDEVNYFDISFTYNGRKPISYSILFDEFAHSQRFTDIIKQPFVEDSIIRIYIPYGDPLPNPKYNPQFLHASLDTFIYKDTTHLEYPRPGTYHMSVFLQNGVCADDRIRVDTVFEMKFPSWIHEQHWNDAIVLFNEKYNGGYEFDDYRWYLEDDTIPGEVQGYLYDPQLLKFGKEYKVKLHIKGDPLNEWHFTCPIIPYEMTDTIVPTKPYVGVVPSCMPPGLDHVDILCTEEGVHSYVITTETGLFVKEGKFKTDSSKKPYSVSIPDGVLFIVHVRTQSGYHRAVKVIRGCELK